MTAPLPGLARPDEVIEVGTDAITLAVVVEPAPVPDAVSGPTGHISLTGRLVLVLRALADPDVVVRIPITDTDAESLVRCLAGSLRWVRPGPECPACGRKTGSADTR